MSFERSLYSYCSILYIEYLKSLFYALQSIFLPFGNQCDLWIPSHVGQQFVSGGGSLAHATKLVAQPQSHHCPPRSVRREHLPKDTKNKGHGAPEPLPGLIRSQRGTCHHLTIKLTSPKSAAGLGNISRHLPLVLHNWLVREHLPAQ